MGRPCVALTPEARSRATAQEGPRRRGGRQVMQPMFRRTAAAPLSPARGARGALALLLSLLAIAGLGRTPLGRSLAVGALSGVLFVAYCDLGPSLPNRTRAMAAGTLLGAPLLVLGDVLSRPWWVPVPALALATFL